MIRDFVVDKVINKVKQLTRDAKCEDFVVLDLDEQDEVVAAIIDSQARTLRNTFESGERVTFSYFGAFAIKEGRRTALEHFNTLLEEYGVDNYKTLTKEERVKFDKVHGDYVRESFRKKKEYKAKHHASGSARVYDTAPVPIKRENN